jgi:hypothetical protein
MSELHFDRERLPVGILRRVWLAHLLIDHAGLTPAHGDRARFVRLREPLTRVGVRGLRLASLCRSGHEMTDGADEWRAAMLEKGWS